MHGRAQRSRALDSIVQVFKGFSINGASNWNENIFSAMSFRFLCVLMLKTELVQAIHIVLGRIRREKNDTKLFRLHWIWCVRAIGF